MTPAQPITVRRADAADFDTWFALSEGRWIDETSPGSPYDDNPSSG